MSSVAFCWCRRTLAIVVLGIVPTARAAQPATTPAPPPPVTRPAVDPVAARNRVLIVPFESLNPRSETDESDARALSRALAFELSAEASIDAVETAEVATDTQAARDAGRASAARFVVWGMIQTAGDRVRVSAQVLDLEAGDDAATDHFKLTGPADEWLEIQDAVVERVERHVLAATTAPSIEEGAEDSARATEPTSADAPVEVPRGEPLRVASRPGDHWAPAHRRAADDTLQRHSRGGQPYWLQAYPYGDFGYGYGYSYGYPHRRSWRGRLHWRYHSFTDYTYRGLPDAPIQYGPGGLGSFHGPVPLHWFDH